MRGFRPATFEGNKTATEHAQTDRNIGDHRETITKMILLPKYHE